MTNLYLLEPEASTAWNPYRHSRPVCELRAGAWLIRERWEGLEVVGDTKCVFGPDHLRHFSEGDSADVLPLGPVEGPALIGRSEFAPAGFTPELADDAAILKNDGDTVGWFVPHGSVWQGPEFAGDEIEIDGILLHGAHDLVTALEHLLAPDVADITHEKGDELPQGSIVIGDPAEVVILGGIVEPDVTFDVRGGAVVIEEGAYLRGNTRLIGPVYIGPGSQVLGGELDNVVLGPVSKVRGELAHTVALGYCNKAHEGFVGHSVIGRWVNLGAGTTTSNLKNTYGEILLERDGTSVATGRTFLGSLFGDHCKTAIGTLLPTGSVIGVGANVFGRGAPPRTVPAMAWGLDGETVNLEGFLRTAERMMQRRKVPFTDQLRGFLTSIHDFATSSP